MTPQPHIQVVLANEDVPATLQRALQRTRATTSFRPLADVLRHGVSTSADAVIVVVPPDSRPVARGVKALLQRMARRPRATLVMKAAGGLVPRLTHPPTLPVTFGGGAAETELLARIDAMLDMRPSLDALHAGARERAESQRALADRHAAQLRVASEVRRELMPRLLPDIGPFRFTTLYRPVDFVSGDIFDVQRLDDEHVGVVLADATGHGIPAALLTVLIKRALRDHAGLEAPPPVLPPDEVLRRLNAEVLSAGSAECRFIAVTYALLNTRTRQVRVARGGCPYPILRRADGTSTLIAAAGPLVGVTREVDFAVEQHQLGPGDALLLYTDGLETLLAPQAGADSAAGPRAHSAEAGPQARVHIASAAATATAAPPAHAEIMQTPWFGLLRTQGVNVALDELAARHDTLRRLGHELDDLTALALQAS